MGGREMRPRYQTVEQQDALQSVREKVALRVKGAAIRRKDRINTVFVKPGSRPVKVVAWADIRCRSRSYYDDRFGEDSVMWDKRTFDAMIDGLGRHSEPIYLVVALPKGVLLARVSTALLSAVRYGVGGRTDRGDPEDNEECVFIPLSRFADIYDDGVRL